MRLNINNSRAPARLAAARSSAAKGAERWGAGTHYADWRNVRSKGAALFGGPIWHSAGTVGYIATEQKAVEGLRSVGYADEIISSLCHNGWYADAGQDELYRGQVWQLPARNGEPVYVYGYIEPNSETAILDAAGGRIEMTSDKNDAARWADSLAEKMALWNRESDEAEQARYQAGERMAESRAEFSAAVKGYKEQTAMGVGEYVCRLLKEKMQDARDGFKKALQDLDKAKERAADVQRYYVVK